MMKKLTMDEKMVLLAEVNTLLATIPDYQLAMSEREMEYNDIFITDKGYDSKTLLAFPAYS